MQELGATFRVGDIPADLMDEAQEWREKLLEQVVEMDDDAMEKYLDVCAYLPHLPRLRHPALPYVLPCCALSRISLQPSSALCHVCRFFLSSLSVRAGQLSISSCRGFCHCDRIQEGMVGGTG